jgi:iron(III) transport system ATP-binding protein
MAVSVQIDKLNKAFGSTRAVDDITLLIEPGELFFLLGPSGCGKTTLLRCIAGFCIPDSGAIRIGNADISSRPPHERDTGMVFQSYALWPHMTVGENVAFGLEIRKISADERTRRVAEALEIVRMSDRADRKPAELSGGQQQRVALARALVIRPQCLLLDEPLSNLDAKLRLDMRAEIRRICKQAGLTAIYVTHDQKESLSIADRLAILDKGRIRQCGKPQEVYLHPNSRFVANFIGETNFLEGTVQHASEGRWEIGTSIGAVISKVAPQEAVNIGSAVTLSLRPEVIRIGSAPGNVSNVFDCFIHNTMYLGEVAQHWVTISSTNTEWKVFELHPKFVARDEQVKSAQAWFDPEDVVILMT